MITFTNGWTLAALIYVFSALWLAIDVYTHLRLVEVDYPGAPLSWWHRHAVALSLGVLLPLSTLSSALRYGLRAPDTRGAAIQLYVDWQLRQGRHLVTIGVLCRDLQSARLTPCVPTPMGAYLARGTPQRFDLCMTRACTVQRLIVEESAGTPYTVRIDFGATPTVLHPDEWVGIELQPGEHIGIVVTLAEQEKSDAA